MRLFNSKEQENFNLTTSDFKTETRKSEVETVWISPELLKLLPKHPTSNNKESSIETKSSKTAIQLFQTSVEISFDPDEVKEDLEQFVQKINRQLDWLSSNRSQIDIVIIKDLFKLKNSTWLKENEAPLSKEYFLNKIKLDSITFFDDTGCELNFNDGNIFEGHTIQVSVTKDKKVEKATIDG